MSVQIGGAPKTIVTVNPNKLRRLSQGNLDADGSEQVLAEYVGMGKLYGTVDLHEMQVGDRVVLRQYIKLLPNSDYQKYAEESYLGIQENPVVYFLEKATDIATKITLQQTEGIFRSSEHNFMVED